MASPAYSREYRDWIANGEFERVYANGSENLATAIDARRPDLVAPALRDLSACYYLRGAVVLLDGKQDGWHDIQCGYLASVYSIRFAVPLLTGVDAILKNSPAYVTHAVMTMGLARIFSVEFDERLLRTWIDERYDAGALTGKVQSGRYILDSLYYTEHRLDAETLRRDRRECCQKRDAWPKRPTEFEPFGILDVEMAINFPQQAKFPYPELPYLPTEDDLVIHGIVTYHQWND